MEVTDSEGATLTQFIVDISDISSSGQARRAAVERATAIGLNETYCGKISIAVTEMATNIVKHAGTGKILCDPVVSNGSCGLRLIALDRGPGIHNISAALKDGYSTYGSSGNGLGAVQRLSTRFDLYSAP